LPFLQKVIELPEGKRVAVVLVFNCLKGIAPKVAGD